MSAIGYALMLADARYASSGASSGAIATEPDFEESSYGDRA